MAWQLANVDGRAVLVAGGGQYDLEKHGGGLFGPDPMAAIGQFDQLESVATRISAAGTLADASFEPGRCGPPAPSPSKVFGIGLNYRSHAAESNMELPQLPLVFTKFPSCIVGPAAEVVLSGSRVDWEVELVVVIGRRGRRIAAADAWSYVAGLTLGQDVSDRKVQMAVKPPQFSMGKSYDTFGPTGPVLASVDSFENPDAVSLTCDVSGERMQAARTDDLIFSVPQLVEYLSSVCTLEPGDLIFTGTPSGVGAARGRYLTAGDVITSTMDVVGTMTNRCIED
jgi:2-keto-4-pentenoate hydratase/2-oxohepta-3-ene-1,7-dioic acid hydratase in catechol pathway